MTDPTAAERIADLYFAGLRMMGFIFEPTAERQAERMLADHVQTALAEAKREVWEKAEKIFKDKFQLMPSVILSEAYGEIETEFRRRSRAHDAD